MVGRDDVRIIDGLEVIDVDHHQAERLLGPQRAPVLLVQTAFEVSSVIDRSLSVHPSCSSRAASARRLLHGFGPLEITFLVTDKTKRIFHASQPEESVVTCKRSIT